jgi:4-amino-4-deoxy-L-arabinose transferase-like glycosyltransferase
MRAADWVWLAACAALSSAWCLGAGAELGATFDEPFYLARGLAGWRDGSHAGLLRAGTMPLAIDAQTLPLALAERWRGAPFDAYADLEHLLPTARVVTLVFWWLLLACGWRAGAELAGPWGGRLAVAFLAAEPSLLAHASLATTDLALAACLLALALAWRTGGGGGWWRRVALPAAWFGAALLAKASAIVVAPLCLLALIAFEERDRWRTRLRDAAAVAALGLLAATAYCGSDWRPEPSFVAWAAARPDDAPLAQPLRWLADHLRVFSNAGEAIVRQGRHNVRGHGTYLLGVTHARALWWYFPVLLTIKLSEPLLLALPAAALVRWRALATWPLLLAAVLVLDSLTFRVQLGVRMVLPIVAFGAVGTGAALAAAIAATPGWRARLLAFVAGAALLANAATAVRLWPDGLVYVNRFWGGPARGYELVSDSNYDWGQGVPALRAWAAARGGSPLAVWYFGTDPRVEHPPLRRLPLHALPLASRADVLALLRGQVLAVGTTLRFGAAIDSPGYRAARAVLAERQPAARVGTFLIYDFTAGPAGGG